MTIDNPDEEPRSVIVAPPLIEADGDAEAIRRASIRHEGTIRMLGMVGYAVGIACGAGALGVGAAALRATPHGGPLGPVRDLAWVGFVGTLAAAGTCLVALGHGLRRFEEWARRAAMAVAWAGLIGSALAAAALGVRGGDASGWLGWLFVPGMALAATLNLLGSPRGRLIFTPGYHGVVLRTPHVHDRPDPAVKAVVGLVVISFTLLVTGAALAVLLRPR